MFYYTKQFLPEVKQKEDVKKERKQRTGKCWEGAWCAWGSGLNEAHIMELSCKLEWTSGRLADGGS